MDAKTHDEVLRHVLNVLDHLTCSSGIGARNEFVSAKSLFDGDREKDCCSTDRAVAERDEALPKGQSGLVRDAFKQMLSDLAEAQRVARILATVVRCNCGDSLTAIETAALDAALAYPCGEEKR